MGLKRQGSRGGRGEELTKGGVCERDIRKLCKSIEMYELEGWRYPARLDNAASGNHCLFFKNLSAAVGILSYEPFVRDTPRVPKMTQVGSCIRLSCPSELDPIGKLATFLGC